MLGAKGMVVKRQSLLSRSFQTSLHPTSTHPARTPLCGKGPNGGKPCLSSEFLETQGPCMSPSQGLPGSVPHPSLASPALQSSQCSGDISNTVMEITFAITIQSMSFNYPISGSLVQGNPRQCRKCSPLS